MAAARSQAMRSGNTWSQELYLKSHNPVQAFGHAVAISGDTVAVATLFDNSGSPGVGAANLFRRIGTAWAQEAYIEASGVGFEDNFGPSVSISGEEFVVGNIGIRGLCERGNGAAFTFIRSQGRWVQKNDLTAPHGGTVDRFGSSVSVFGDVVEIGDSFCDARFRS